MGSFFKQQSLFKLRLNKNYYLELVGLDFLKCKDLQGNPLTLYESDYNKLYAYLKTKHIDHFSDLTTAEKLQHLANANVRVTRYFSAENRQKYELDVKATLACQLSDMVSKNGTKLLKDGKQNCVVVFEHRIYIHPKVRCVAGAIAHEVIAASDGKAEVKEEKISAQAGGVIGINHSSLSAGRQVEFPGSIVYTKEHGWTLDTTSGHYITRAYQIKALLQALQDQGMDLKPFTVKLWIPKNPGVIPPVLSEADYHILYENADDYMTRMKDSQSRYVSEVGRAIMLR
jgi:hypothetical protein